MSKKEKVLEAGRKEGTLFSDSGMNFIVTQQYRKTEVEGNVKIQKEITKINIGNCFNCDYDLNTSHNVFGIIDNNPVYISCPKCKAVNNYKSRVYVSEE